MLNTVGILALRCNEFYNETRASFLLGYWLVPTSKTRTKSVEVL